MVTPNQRRQGNGVAASGWPTGNAGLSSILIALSGSTLLGSTAVVGRSGFDVSAKLVGTVHEREMRERLRKVPELTVFFGIVFLRQKADIVAQRQQMLEKRARFIDPALQDVVVHHPKTTSEKGSLIPYKAVHRALGAIPLD